MDRISSGFWVFLIRHGYTKGSRRQPEERLQRRPHLPRSRFRGRPDGQGHATRTNNSNPPHQPHCRRPLHAAYIQNLHHGVGIKKISTDRPKPGRSAPSFSRAPMARLFDYEFLRQAADQPALGLLCQRDHRKGSAVFSGALRQRNADVLSGGGGAAAQLVRLRTLLGQISLRQQPVGELPAGEFAGISLLPQVCQRSGIKIN